MAELSEWWKIMLGEVSRKSEEDSRAVVESHARAAESASCDSTPVPVSTIGTH